MIDPSFTPGPWCAVDRGHGSEIEPSIAWIGYGSAHSEEEHKANACLIAAAPELLEALKNIENDDGSIPGHAWKMIQAAIQKAEGAEP